MELDKADEAGVKAGQILSAARKNGFLVIHIKHLSTRSGATFFIPDTPGSEIHPCVTPEEELVITKNFPNSFKETNLLENLEQRDIELLVICGMMTHMCVDSTVRAAADLGYRCIVAADACATKDLIWQGETIPSRAVQGAFLSAMAGLFADVKNTDEIINTFFQG